MMGYEVEHTTTSANILGDILEGMTQLNGQWYQNRDMVITLPTKMETMFKVAVAKAGITMENKRPDAYLFLSAIVDIVGHGDKWSITAERN